MIYKMFLVDDAIFYSAITVEPLPKMDCALDRVWIGLCPREKIIVMVISVVKTSTTSMLICRLGVAIATLF